MYAVMWKVLFLVWLITCCWQPLLAASVAEDIATQKTGFKEALARVTVAVAAPRSATGSSPDLEKAQHAVVDLGSAWATCEDAVRTNDRLAYATIEEALGDLQYTVQSESVDLEAARAAATRLTNLTAAWGTPAPLPHQASGILVAPSPGAVRTIADIHTLVVTARRQLADGKSADAMLALAEARRCWPDVEGAVKTRDSQAYIQIEELFARTSSQVKALNPAADSSLTLLATTLAPFTIASSYGVMDAFLILVREGIEALFVISALLAYLGRSGHAAHQRVIWWGAGAGVVISVGLAVIIHLIFQATFSGEHREAIEGFVGLVAAGLLFWVSWWLHRASSLSRWNTYIANCTTAALATGSVWSLAMLAFLAVVREGAETALFYLGMAPSIATRDLFIGIGLGTLALVVIGMAIIQLGARLPIRPLFAVLGVLLLAMGIKFIGAGVHALQIAGLVSASVIAGLPTIQLLGFFPTWETALAQGIILVVLATALLISRLVRSTQIPRTNP